MPGLRRALASFERQGREQAALPALDEPGAIETFRELMERSLVAGGATLEEARRTALVNSLVLDEIRASAGDLQAQIDASQARSDAAIRTVFPEYGDVAAEEEPAPVPDPDPDAEDDPDDGLVRLRATLSRIGPV